MLGDAAVPLAQHLAVFGEQHGGRLTGDAKGTPRLERLVPQHREGRVEPVGERLGELEIILGAKSDDSDVIAMFASKLLDTGRLGPAGASMRCPEPEQHRFVRRQQ